MGEKGLLRAWRDQIAGFSPPCSIKCQVRWAAWRRLCAWPSRPTTARASQLAGGVMQKPVQVTRVGNECGIAEAWPEEQQRG